MLGAYHPIQLYWVRWGVSKVFFAPGPGRLPLNLTEEALGPGCFNQSLYGEGSQGRGAGPQHFTAGRQFGDRTS
jgi:hypothetical protein